MRLPQELMRAFPLVKYTFATKTRVVGLCGKPMGTPDLASRLQLCTSLLSTSYSKTSTDWTASSSQWTNPGGYMWV